MNKRRILVDVTILTQVVNTDIYRVADQIVKYLMADKSLEVFFTLSEEDFFQQKNIDLKTGLIKYCEESNFVTGFIDAKTDPAFTDIDIYLSTNYQVPKIWKKEHRVKKAAIAYDLIPLLYPDLFERETIQTVSNFYNHLEVDWLIFSTSENTRNDLMAYRPDLDPDNIVVLNLGVDENSSFHIISEETGARISDDHVIKTKTRPQQFSWEKCAEVLVNSINNIELDNTPFLSIITICHNAKYIEETCRSLAEQSFQKFEWIIVDAKSDQETLGIFDKYKSHITFLVSESDDGRYDAMNKGIILSRGKYLLFLNGGDFLYDKRVLEKIFSYSIPLNLISIFKLTLNSEIIYGEIVSKETGMMPYPLWKTGPQEHNIDFFSKYSLPHQATFIKRELFQKIGLYDKNLKYAGDYEWFMRSTILHAIKTQYLPIIVSVYNFEGISSSSRNTDAPNQVEIRNLNTQYLNTIEKTISQQD